MVVLTGNMISTDNFASLVLEKLKKLKNSFLEEYKTAIDNYFEEKMVELKAFIVDSTSVIAHVNNNELNKSTKIIQNNLNRRH